jgi:hypothetical protein
MWQCRNCGEQVAENLDVCWNCRNGREAAVDAESRVEPPDRVRIVELCSAANMIEANMLCNLLEESGIKAQVAGEVLGNAAGGLPCGEPIAPRIWVGEGEVVRARQIVSRWRAESQSEPAEWPEDSEAPEWQASGVQEEQPETTPPTDGGSTLSGGLVIAGVVCILIGAGWAMHNSVTLSKYSATTEGRRIVSRRSASQDGRYGYMVSGKKYEAVIKKAMDPPPEVTIRYDPDHPADHIVGSPTPPWAVLLIASAMGVFLMFVGYQFR